MLALVNQKYKHAYNFCLHVLTAMSWIPKGIGWTPPPPVDPGHWQAILLMIDCPYIVAALP